MSLICKGHFRNHVNLTSPLYSKVSEPALSAWSRTGSVPHFLAFDSHLSSFMVTSPPACAFLIPSSTLSYPSAPSQPVPCGSTVLSHSVHWVSLWISSLITLNRASVCTIHFLCGFTLSVDHADLILPFFHSLLESLTFFFFCLSSSCSAW